MTATLAEPTTLKPGVEAHFTINDAYRPVRHSEGEGHSGMPFASILVVGFREDYPLDADADERPGIGDVVSARRSTSHNCFYMESAGHGSLIFHGSRLNVPLGPGALVGLQDGTVLRVERYSAPADGNPAFVSGDIITSPGGFTGMLTSMRWVELEAKPETAEPAEPAEPADSAAATVEFNGALLCGELDRIVRRLPLCPTPVDGQYYLLWDGGDPNVAQRVRLSIWDAKTEKFWGLYRIRTGRNASRSTLGYSDEYHSESIGTQQWVPADRPGQAPEVVKEDRPQLMADIADQRRRTAARREEFSDRLNDLAEDNSYCSEFESIVQGVGLPGRVKSQNDVEVTIHAEVRLSDDSPSSRIDNLVGEDAGATSLSLSNAEYTGTMNVTVSLSQVEVTTETDYDDVYELIPNDDVEDAITEMLDGYTLESLESWSVEGFRIV